ncbi:unnamed protein product, partial [Ixodes persulcatus]
MLELCLEASTSWSWETLRERVLDVLQFPSVLFARCSPDGSGVTTFPRVCVQSQGLPTGECRGNSRGALIVKAPAFVLVVHRRLCMRFLPFHCAPQERLFFSFCEICC